MGRSAQAPTSCQVTSGPEIGSPRHELTPRDDFGCAPELTETPVPEAHTADEFHDRRSPLIQTDAPPDGDLVLGRAALRRVECDRDPWTPRNSRRDDPLGDLHRSTRGKNGRFCGLDRTFGFATPVATRSHSNEEIDPLRNVEL